jgi:hypothetical protein
MANLDALAGDLAEGLIEWRARSVTPREAMNEIGAVPDLSDGERDELLAAVLDKIEHADIEITIH